MQEIFHDEMKISTWNCMSDSKTDNIQDKTHIKLI